MAKNKKDNYKQIIVTRLDLTMSAGQIATLASHASMAFLTRQLQRDARRLDADTVRVTTDFDYGLWQGWLDGTLTKVVLGVRDENDLLSLIESVEEHGLERDKDFFCIYDRSSLHPIPPDSDGTWLACVGFRPMRGTEIDPITRGIRLYT